MGGGGAVLVLKMFSFFKNQFSTNDNTYKLGLAILIVVALVFFLKPIILCAIRWIILLIIHKRELDNKDSNTSRTFVHDRFPKLFNKLYDELDDHDHETTNDLNIITKLSDYKNRKKESGE